MNSVEVNTELLALRNLENAIRACGLPGMMVSGQPQLEMLSAALKEVVAARGGESLPHA